MKSGPLTTGAIAGYCHVTYCAVLKWIAAGKLKAYRTPGKHCRVKREDFLNFLRKFQMPVPAELVTAGGQNGFKKVLIVDDDKETAHAINRMLRLSKGSYETSLAFDGFDAGKKVYEFRPDLIILDIRMPGIDGYEVVKRIKKDKANHRIRIIAISAFFQAEGREKIMRLGADLCLEKPIEKDELLKSAEKLLTNR